MRESKIESHFKSEVEKQGAWVVKFTPQGLRGMPDRIVLMPNAKTYFVELKAPGKTMRALQEKRKKQLEELGFKVWCIDSYEGVSSFIKEVMPSEVHTSSISRTCHR